MRNLLFSMTDLMNNDLSIPEGLDYSRLLGLILMNRMGGVCFLKLHSLGILSQMPKEFKNTLRQIHNSYIESNNRQKKDISLLTSILSTFEKPYSLLKGSFLSLEIYPEGARISNDYDILVNQENIKDIQQVLLDKGFKQGFYSHDYGFSAASRKQIIESRMQNGETIPFVKVMGKNALIIDINFSIDYKAKSDKNIVEKFLQSRTLYKHSPTIQFYTLSKYDFLLHLCCHLYKEATTYNWVENSTDLTLYKFYDIYLYIYKLGNPGYFRQIIKRIAELNLEKECYYTFENISMIYPNINKVEGFVEAKEAIKPNDLTFMKQVILPRDKKLFQYNMSFLDWFFCWNRVAELEEIMYERN